MVALQYMETGCVQQNNQLNPDSFEMQIYSPQIAQRAEPGQFVMVSCSEVGLSPLLRRPLSIHDVHGDTLTLLYRVVGEGTAVMAGMGAGDTISILGPLGQGFTIAETDHHCLVGGGIGIAPLLLLARKIDRTQPKAGITILAGARNSQELLAIKKFETMGTLHISTDDGSEGHHGFVTQLLDKMHDTSLSVYTCGPTPMMQGVAKLCREHGWDCQVSLESHMACGIGACLGCAVARSGIHEGADKYVHVCKDGPVFKAEVIWA